MRASLLPSVLLVVALALTACQPAAPEAPAATLRPSVEDSPSPTPNPSRTPTEASFAPPDPIDAAYAERVLNRLYRTEGGAIRELVENRAVTDEARRLLLSIYGDQYAPVILENFEDLAGQELSGLRDPPGDATFRVDRIIAAESGCVFLAGQKQFDAVEDQPRDRTGEVDFIALVADPTPEAENPTGWVIGDSRLRIDGAEEPNLCEQ